jgi:carbonic anhydrase/acetyltransferase-like protein (isoleucine patch superfamily)
MIYRLGDQVPQIADNAFIAPTATVIGQVNIEAEVSIWFGAVLRGDAGLIKIGQGTNIQDNSVIHVNQRANTIIDQRVTLGHGVIAEGCHIHSDCLIGMGATVLSGSVVGKGSLVAAGSVVREHQIIPEGVLVAGVPAKVIRPLTPKDQQRIREAAQHYIEHRLDYLHKLHLL